MLGLDDTLTFLINRASTLARQELYFDKPTTTGVVNRLVKKKYVKKVKNRKDRRVTHVFITDAGKEALTPVDPIVKFYQDNFLKDISPEAYETAKEVLKTMIKNIKSVEI